MIARKIVYTGNFDKKALEAVYELGRRLALTGEIKNSTQQQLEMNLEGDPSMIKLLQHQIERRIRGQISRKDVTPVAFQYFQQLSFSPTWGK